MPGIEVYTISGAADYDPTTGQPADGKLVPVTSSPPAAQLQNALKALGVTQGDPALISVSVDGIIGPKTVKAVNYALATYIGATKYFPAANLDIVKVRQYAGGLASMVIDRVHKSGGTVPTVVVHHPVRRAAASPAAIMANITEPGSSDIGAQISQFVSDHKQAVWLTVGGISALILLSAAASAAKKRKSNG